MSLSESLGVNLALAANYASRFTKHLEAGEMILNAGQGIELAREKTTGESGDATLAITTLGVLAVYDDGKIWRINHSDISSFSVNRVWTIVPKVREINVVSRLSPDMSMLFHGGKTFAREVSVLLPIQRLVSDIKVAPVISPFDPVQWIAAGLSGASFDYEYSSTYLDNYVKASSTNWLDYVPIRSTDMERCAQEGDIFATYLKDAIDKDFSGQLRHVFFATEIPRIHKLWNPYTASGIAELISKESESHKQILCDWYNLKHDLLEASFRAAWHLMKSGEPEFAKAVITLGVTLCDGSDRLVFERLNKVRD
jgi:hypothetical protein